MVPATQGSESQIPCNVFNKTTKPIILLNEAFALEGPIDNASSFPLFGAGPERFENLLRYADRPRWGELFNYRVDLKLGSLQHLIRLQARSTIPLEVSWPIPADGTFPNRGSWVCQLKLIYLDEDALIRFQRDSRIPRLCKKQLTLAVKKAVNPPSLKVKTFRPKIEARYIEGTCLNLISDAFEHEFSNMFTLRVLR